ncbi:uncharacterized protein [Oscarella lobularis]|uniref:uncharacterized protein n=1 Tax=Oscarella lobularis TaxID=121494 RepID=UPI0033141E03
MQVTEKAFLLLLIAGTASEAPPILQAEITAELQSVFSSEAVELGLLPILGANQISVTTPCRKLECIVSVGHELKVRQLYKAVVPHFAEEMSAITFFDDPSTSPLDFNINYFAIDLDEKLFLVRASAGASIQFVSGFLELDAVIVEFGVTYDTTKPLVTRFSLSPFLAFVVKGNWIVGAVVFKVVATRTNPTSYQVTGSPTKDVNVNALFQSLGETLLPEGEMNIALVRAGMNNFVLKSVDLQAYYDRSVKNFAFCLSGAPSISGWSGAKLHVMFSRYNGGARKVATIGVEFKSSILATIVKKISEIDMTSVPFFGTLTVPRLGLVVSTGLIDPLLLPNCFGDLLKESLPWPSGFSVRARFALPDDANDELTYDIRINSKTVTIVQAPNEMKTSFTLRKVASMTNMDSGSILWPPTVSDAVLDSVVNDIVYDAIGRKLTVTVNLGDSLVIVPNWVRFLKPELRVDATLSPIKVTVKIDGQWSIGPVSFAVEVKPASPTDSAAGYVVVGSGAGISIGEIVEYVGSSFFPPGIHVNIFDSFEIGNPYVEIPIRHQPRTIFLSGKLKISGFSGVTVNFYSEKNSAGESSAAVGFDFPKIKFADIVQKVTGKSIGVFRLLAQNLKVGVVISAADFAEITFREPTLRAMGSIKQGLVITAISSLPPCNDDPICNLIKPIVGDKSLEFTTTIADTNAFTVSATVSDITLGSGVTLQSVGLELAVTATSEPTFGVACQLRLNKPALLFYGALRAIPTGELVAEFKMIGMWKRAFGLEWLSFGNVIMKVKFFPGGPPTAFELGGEVHIGNVDRPERQLKAKAYVGVDMTNPQNNYFYASINGVTLEKVLHAFGIDVNLISPLRNTGFPKGLEVSYSAIGRTVAGINIPMGFKLKGTLNILGLEVNADILVDPSRGIDVQMAMSPIVLANGAFKMLASESERDRGPSLRAKIQVQPLLIDLRATGYVELFGFLRASAELRITNSQYLMTVTASFFGFPATLTIYAAYGALKQASFGVEGELSAEWLNKLESGVEAAVKKGADEASQMLSAAQEKVDQAKAVFDSTSKKLKDARDKVKRLCSIKSCRRVCVGCPGWNGCCWKVWRSCQGCPRWNSCCTRVTDPVCAAANVVCKGLRSTAYAAMWAAEKTVEAAKSSLNGATSALEGVKSAVKLGMAAATWFAQNLLVNELISIKKIWFDVQIDSVSGGSFGGSIRVSFLKQSPIQFSFDLRFRDVAAMVKNLADRVSSKIAGRKRRDVDVAGAALSSQIEDVRRRQAIAPLTDASPTAVEWRTEPTSVESTSSKPAGESGDFEENKGNDVRAVDEDIREFERLAGNETQNWIVLQGSKLDFDNSLIPEDIEAEPQTDEEKCRRFKKFASFIREILHGLDIISTSFIQSLKPFTAQESAMGGCLTIVYKAKQQGGALETMARQNWNDLQKLKEMGMPKHLQNKSATLDGEKIIGKCLKEKEIDEQKAEMLCSAIDKMKAQVRSVFRNNNLHGLHAVFAELSEQVQRKFKKPLKEFLVDMCQSIERMYENRGGPKRPGAHKVYTLVTKVCQHLGVDGDGNSVMKMTILRSHQIVKTLLAKFQKLSGIRVYCSATGPTETW